MVGLSSPVAKVDGVKGDCCTRIAVVGDQVIVWVASDVVEVVAADPPEYPTRVVVMVATEAVFGATPVIVASPVPLIETLPLEVAVPAHVKFES